MIRPLKENKVGGVFKKNKMALEEHSRLLRQLRPLDSPYIEQRPNGWLFKNLGGGSTTYTPPFSPARSGENLTITPGWLNGPKAAGTDYEIPEYHLYPYMPVIGSGGSAERLDATEAPSLTLTNGQTNWIYLQITLTQRAAVIGETDLGLGSVGATVWNDTAASGVTLSTDDGHTHTATVVGHQHEIQVDFAQLAYHIDESVPPTFKVTTAAAVPVAPSAIVTNIPWGKYVLDSDGAEVDPHEWYYVGDRDFTPPTWIRSNVSEGYGSPAANDASINPATA